MESKLHGSVITLRKFLDLNINREVFLNQDEIKRTEIALSKREPILFLPSYSYEQSMFRKDAYEKASYRIIMIGILKDGRKVTVVVENILPFLEIMADNKKYIEVAKTFISRLNQAQITPTQQSMMEAKPLIGYRHEAQKCLRFYFRDLKQRKQALQIAAELNLDTYTDQYSNYYQIPCRQYDFSLSKWCILENYELTSGYNHNLAGRVFRINVLDIKRCTEETVDLMRDKTTSVAWDIETYSPDMTLPNPLNPRDKMFMLAATIHWNTYRDTLLRVIFSEFPTKPHPDFLTVACGNEIGIFRGFIKLISSLKPEFIIGFNDSDYDWKWLMERGKLFDETKGTNLIFQMAEAFDATSNRYNWNTKFIYEVLYKKPISVKFAPNESIVGYALRTRGCTPIDVRTQLIVANPKTESSSLKYFLDKSKLPSKVDMPIAKLFQIYAHIDSIVEIEANQQLKVEYANRNTSIEDIRSRIITDSNIIPDNLLADYTEVAYYCVIDAQSCHLLMLKNNIFSDKRSIANDSYVSLDEAFFRANGSKVQTLCMYYGERPPFNLRMTARMNRKISKTKYPGALVIKPKKGLIKPKLTFLERIEKQKKVFEHDPSKVDSRWIELEKTPHYITIWNALISKVGIHMPKENASLYELRAKMHECGITKIFNLYIEYALHKISDMHQDYVNAVRAIATPFTDKDVDAILGQCPDMKKSDIIDIITSDLFDEFMRDENGLPVLALDFSSLYPSIMMAYNISPEKCISDQKLAERLHEEKKTITASRFTYEDVLRQYWFLHHDNHCDIKDPQFSMGVFPYVLKRLFDERASLKNKLKAIAAQIKEAEQQPIVNHTEIEELEFTYNYYNAKQNAVKVFMNTFYGTCGSQMSPLFLLGAAASVTAFGRQSLETAYKFLKSVGCFVVYGDTDSTYCMMPKQHFLHLDIQYFTGQMDKIPYMTELVQVTHDIGLRLNKEVNELFKLKTNNIFLKMAYEEILYPMHLVSKKKYTGKEHKPGEEKINFDIPVEKFFVRGLDMRRRGICKFQKDMLNECLRTFMDSFNLFEPIEIIQRLLDEIFQRKIPIQDFAQSDAYRKEKQNVKVQTYRARMLERGIELKPIERFWYVIAKVPPYKYDVNGRKIKVKVGEMMEPLEDALQGKAEVDIVHYAEKLITPFGRFIIYMPQFSQENDKDLENDAKRLVVGDEDSKKLDELSLKSAKKYLSKIIEKYEPKYAQLSAVYKNAFEDITTGFVDKIKSDSRIISQILNKKLKVKNIMELAEYYKNLVAKPENYSEKLFKRFMKNKDKETRKRDFAILRSLYYDKYNQNNISIVTTANYKINKEKIKCEMSIVQEKLRKLIANYENILMRLSNKIRSHIVIPEKYLRPMEENKKVKAEEVKLSIPSISSDIEDALEDLVTSEEYVNCTKELFNIIAKYIANERKYEQTNNIVEYLKNKHNNALGFTTAAPSGMKEIFEQIKNSLEKVPLPF